jgi:DNA mismatch repair protein MSH4
MTGKSTYVQQVALLSIMSQIGMFVPAEYAAFRICDNIFCLFGDFDDVKNDLDGAKYILDNVTDTSLVLIDDLGKGPSCSEGVGLCVAVCEELLEVNDCAFTFFATHFEEVFIALESYPNVVELTLQVSV